MKLSEEKLKLMWQETTPIINKEKSLKKVLDTSSKVTATKDVTGLFFGWIWVVFLGFGASMYSAKRKLDLHKQSQLKTTTNKQQKKPEDVATVRKSIGDMK